MDGDEIFRVLKAGGRVAVSDIALKKELPAELAGDLMAYVGCIAGAISIEAYRNGLIEAGFSAVQVNDSGADLNAYAKVENQSGCCSPSMEPEAVVEAESAVEAEPAGTCCGGGSKLNRMALAKSGPCSTEAPSTVHGGLAGLLKKYDVNDYAASVKVYAVKR